MCRPRMVAAGQDREFETRWSQRPPWPGRGPTSLPRNPVPAHSLPPPRGVRLTSRAAADVGDSQTADIPEQFVHPGFFHGDEGVAFSVINLRPAIIAVPRGKNIDGLWCFL